VKQQWLGFFSFLPYMHREKTQQTRSPRFEELRCFASDWFQRQCERIVLMNLGKRSDVCTSSLINCFWGSKRKTTQLSRRLSGFRVTFSCHFFVFVSTSRKSLHIDVDDGQCSSDLIILMLLVDENDYSVAGLWKEPRNFVQNALEVIDCRD
jgi:hypothetical protein